MARLKELVEAEIKELKVKPKRIESRIETQIRPLIQEKDQLQVQIQSLISYLRATGAETEGTEAILPLKPRQGKETSLDVIERVFRKAARPLHYKEVLKLAENGEGFKIPGKDPVANLSAKLSVSPRFKRVGKGIYILSEWEETEKRFKPQ